jgi:hypothetical protein
MLTTTYERIGRLRNNRLFAFHGAPRPRGVSMSRPN